jgi:hypothetical protein
MAQLESRLHEFCPESLLSIKSLKLPKPHIILSFIMMYLTVYVVWSGGTLTIKQRCEVYSVHLAGTFLRNYKHASIYALQITYKKIKYS